MRDTGPAVFVVDSDTATRNALTTLLFGLGLPARAHATAEEMLAGYTAGDAGCVISSICLPGMNGLELFERMLSADREPPFILHTCCANIRTAVQAMQRGVFTVIEKPAEPAELTAAIRAALAENAVRRRRRGPHVALRERYLRLDAREREVMHQIVRGEPNKRIARRLGISQRTVDRIRAAVYDKLAADSVFDLARVACALDGEEPALPTLPATQHSVAAASDV